MRKNFIKYLACALVAVMLLGTTAFAATTTTTTYKGDYITVSTQVTDAAENEQVTYLVYQESDGVDGIADSEIIYINQKAATDGVATFDYKVVKGSPLPSGTAIIAGSTSGTVSATEGDNIDPLAVTVVNNTDLEVTYDAVLGKGEKGSLTIADYTGGKAYVNDVEYTGAIEIVGGETYTVTFVADEVPAAPSITQTASQDSNVSEETPEENYVARFATISIPENYEKTVSYGIVFAVGAVDNLTVESEGALVYPALGQKDGQFAVKLVDGGEGVIVAGQDYTTRAYMCIDGVYTYAD